MACYDPGSGRLRAVLMRTLNQRRAWPFGAALAILIFSAAGARSQDLNSLPPSSREQWNVFVDETTSPLFAGAAFFNAGLSQLRLGSPAYGAGAAPFAERFGAEAADIATQNFFGDYVMASLLHEDTRYVRKGRGHGFWARFAHAAASGFVTRRFSGGQTVNWSNLVGTAISVGLSDAYYPPVNRTLSDTAINFAASAAGAGLGNLAPEFWPDFHHWLIRHRLAPDPAGP